MKLDYSGNLDDRFEWAKYIGVANPEIYGHIPDLPRERLSIHHAPRLYREDPPEYTYRDLKRILEIMRAAFAARGLSLRFGATFDPGPDTRSASTRTIRGSSTARGWTVTAGTRMTSICRWP